MSDPYASMLRSHVKENNRRLGRLEKKFEKISRRIEEVRQDINSIHNNFVKLGDVYNMDDADPAEQE